MGRTRVREAPVADAGQLPLLDTGENVGDLIDLRQRHAEGETTGRVAVAGGRYAQFPTR